MIKTGARLPFLLPAVSFSGAGHALESLYNKARGHGPLLHKKIISFVIPAQAGIQRFYP
jgi:hypothetical protein